MSLQRLRCKFFGRGIALAYLSRSLLSQLSVKTPLGTRLSLSAGLSVKRVAFADLLQRHIKNCYDFDRLGAQIWSPLPFFGLLGSLCLCTDTSPATFSLNLSLTGFVVTQALSLTRKRVDSIQKPMSFVYLKHSKNFRFEVLFLLYQEHRRHLRRC